jgi:hypothetical protein
MIKLVDLLREITLLEYNKSHLDYIAAKLNVKDKNEFNSLMNALDTQGIKYPDLKKQIEDNSLKTIEDLKKLKTVSKTDKEKQIKSDVVKILDNSDFLIIQPKTYEANCYYGAGTRWCTTDKEEGPEAFEDYTEDNPITFIIDKSKSKSDPLYKVALSYEEYYDADNDENVEFELTFWDAKDEEINVKKYFKYLKNKGVNLKKILKL